MISSDFVFKRVFILVLGLLRLAGMWLMAVKSSVESLQRTLANFLTFDISERVLLNDDTELFVSDLGSASELLTVLFSKEPVI